MALIKLITDSYPLQSVKCDNCGHIYVAHKLDANRDRKSSLFSVGRCLIAGCSCTSYADKIKIMDEELL